MKELAEPQIPDALRGGTYHCLYTRSEYKDDKHSLTRLKTILVSVLDEQIQRLLKIAITSFWFLPAVDENNF
ncbi:hypothetical protein RN001_011722 [Aquatica leii]|uniref:Uncharacterized protein n=1 Tax=Aquatica leii TaxID=1421715 RepID=A0AAN7Q102_9COLE|nr:hypothetical protein RN001_011722 [Aquatica leii]